MIYIAEVVEILKDYPGLRVRFRDLVQSGFAAEDFVRVLCPRMSKSGGASGWLPVVGEFGFVAELNGGAYVWLGSVGMLDGHQFDLTPGLAFLRHDSGLTIQIRENGDFEVAHPSGARLTISKEDAPLPELKATSTPTTGDTEAPVVRLDHPSGTSFSISKGGGVSLNTPLFAVDGAVKIDGTLSVSTGASGTFTTPAGLTVTVQNGVVTNIR